jgi:phosphoglycerate dehydrogenase-like enzyme
MFERHYDTLQALYYKPSFERLEDRIMHACPKLDVVLMDEEGRLTHKGRPVELKDIHPQYCWIHAEMVKSPMMKTYFQIMAQCESIKWLHTINTGLDLGPYLDLLKRRITITNNHSQAIAIAEYVMGHVLSHFQNLADYQQRQQRGEWKYRPFREISGTRWVIIGFGHIGQQVACRAKAFGVHVTAVRRGKKDAGLADTVCHLDNMNEALQQADVVVLACASNEGTRNLVNSEFLGQMKDNAVIVNIARGDIVVEEDLKTALDAGRPGHAILDVFRQEPLPEDSWLWHHPGVSLTSHCSNAGSGMLNRSDELFLENLYRKTNGQILLNLVSEKDIL